MVNRPGLDFSFSGLKTFTRNVIAEQERADGSLDQQTRAGQELARRAAAAFVDLSRTNQVLVLTCHQWIVDLFTEAAPEAALVDLSAVRAAP